MSEIIHPQIDIYSVTQAKIAEETLIANACSFFGLNNNPRHKSKIATFRGLYEKFREIGLLRDLDWNSKSDKDLYYIKLCLARAEKYRQNNEKQKSSNFSNVKIDDLPLGPFEFILFKPESYLEHLLRNRTVSTICCACQETIKPTKSVFLPCECVSIEYCSDCVVRIIGAHSDTFHGKQLSNKGTKGAYIQCPICRIPQYYSIRNEKEAIEEEKRLVSDAFDRLTDITDKKKRQMQGLSLQSVFMNLNEETIREGWVKNEKKIYEIEIMLEDKFFSTIKCDIARMQVSISF